MCFEKWANHGLFFVYFQYFQSNITILQQINVKNVHPVNGCRDSKSQPSDCESPPLTARPGLPPNSQTKLPSFLYSFCSF